MLVGLLLVIVSLVWGKWLPDYENANRGHVVTHQQRLLGQDEPLGASVERRPGYIFYRVLDGLVYLALAQAMMGLLALTWRYDHFFVGLMAAAGLYGMIYCAEQGLIVGAQIAFVGFSFIFMASGLELLSNYKTRARHYGGTHSAA